MVRVRTLSGQVVTITETKGSDTTKRHWFTVSGTAQGVLDYMNENNIPEHKVKGMSVASTTYFVLYHK